MKTFKHYLNEWSKTSPGIKTELVAKGYQFLGKGVDQSAYLEPHTGQVLKIFGASSYDHGFSKDHEMFKFWVDYCKKNSSNEFLPKFFGWETFIYKGKTYLQIRMERLLKLPPKLGIALERLNEVTVQADPKTRHKNYNELIFLFGHESIENARYPETKELVIKRDRVFNRMEDFSEDSLTELNKLVILVGIHKFNELFETLEEIGEIGRKKDWGIDLHMGNFMHRNDGIPVIVDPWVI